MKQPRAPIFNARNLLWLAIGVCLALALLIGLFLSLDISLDTIVDQWAGVPLWGFVLLIGLNALIFGLSAFQWRITLAATSQADAPPPFSALWFYTTMGAMLGQFIPVQFSILLVRSAMLRMQRQATLTRGGSTSLLEQGIALWVPLLLSFPGLAAISGEIGFLAWGVSSVGMLVFGWFLMLWIAPRLTKHLDPNTHARLWALPGMRFIGPRLREIAEMNLFDPVILRTLFRLALVRFGLLAVRIMLFIYLLDLGLAFEKILYIVPLGQVMLLFNLTPGNLGVREWTWVGLLTLSGIESDTAGSYMLAQRGLLFISLVITWLLTFLIHVGQTRQRARSLVCEETA